MTERNEITESVPSSTPKTPFEARFDPSDGWYEWRIYQGQDVVANVVRKIYDTGRGVQAICEPLQDTKRRAMLFAASDRMMDALRSWQAFYSHRCVYCDRDRPCPQADELFEKAKRLSEEVLTP